MKKLILADIAVFIFSLLIVLSPYSFFDGKTNQLNAEVVIKNYEHIKNDTIWTAEEGPYLIEGFNRVFNGVKLTIKPGAIVKLYEKAALYDSGELIIEGTEESPVIFTSIYDDEVGGDNSPWTDQLPWPGSWGTLGLQDGGNLTIDRAIFKYGGLDPAWVNGLKSGVIFVWDGTVNITNSEFTENIRALYNYWNYYPVSIHNSKIYNNQSGGIKNNSYATVDATNNWWGDDSGPYHPTLNPAGRGDAIQGVGNIHILFDPWIGKKEKKDPVIIVPGIMGSWYSNKDGWRLDPILNTYDNLYKALVEIGGYIPEETLFVFPYEWRQDNVLTAYQLKQKIDEIKNICQCGQVDIIAHSMGGLVARYYIENDNYDNDIDQLIFLGTPHKGSPKAYLKWEGASGFETTNEKLMKIYFTFEAHSIGYDTLFNYIQDNIKSVEQLLPNYTYLRNVGEVSLRPYDKINYPNNYTYNAFLENLNSEDKINQFINSGINVFNIIGNTGDNTINVIEVSSGESYWPMWKHGYAEEVVKLAGDGTVPEVSSSLFIPTKINNTDHNSLPTKAQKQIIEYLTGRMPVIEINDTPEPEEILVVAIYSPADFAIISPSGKRLGKDFLSNTSINQIDYAFYTGFEDEPEFAVIVNPEQGDYKVELRGTGNGEYKLDLSYINEEKEITKEFTGNIQTGEDHNFNFTYNNEGEDPVSELEPDDNIPPEITINNPVENEQYLRSEELTVDYTATDDFSGVADTAISMDNQILSTTTIDLFYYDLGEHILNITAVDNAGNSASAEVKFEIITNIDGAIRDIERIYSLDWISKKYVKQILITELEVLRKRLDIFAKQKDNIEKLKQKLSDNPKIKEKHKQKLLDQFDKRLQELEQQEDKFIEKSLSLFVKTLDKFLQKAVINQQGYDIIISDINYLRENL